MACRTSVRKSVSRCSSRWRKIAPASSGLIEWRRKPGSSHSRRAPTATSRATVSSAAITCLAELLGQRRADLFLEPLPDPMAVAGEFGAVPDLEAAGPRQVDLHGVDDPARTGAH